jgi:hypothetical protein
MASLSIGPGFQRFCITPPPSQTMATAMTCMRADEEMVDPDVSPDQLRPASSNNSMSCKK